MQQGGSIPVFSGTSYQRGHGLGRVVKAVWREATPILKQAGKRALKSGLSAVTTGIFGSKRKRKFYDIEKDERDIRRPRASSRGRGIPSTRARTVVRGRGASRSGRGGARSRGGIQTQKGSGQASSRNRREKDIFDEGFEQENDN